MSKENTDTTKATETQKRNKTRESLLKVAPLCKDDLKSLRFTKLTEITPEKYEAIKKQHNQINVDFIVQGFFEMVIGAKRKNTLNNRQSNKEMQDIVKANCKTLKRAITDKGELLEAKLFDAEFDCEDMFGELGSFISLLNTKDNKLHLILHLKKKLNGGELYASRSQASYKYVECDGTTGLELEEGKRTELTPELDNVACQALERLPMKVYQGKYFVRRQVINASEIIVPEFEYVAELWV